MNISMYQARAPRFADMLNSLAGILDKAAAHAEARMGMQYLLGFALPNFYFRVLTAYAILRHNGVELGKQDYIGNP